MTATNMKQLKQMIIKRAEKAMSVASEKMLADMYDETAGFYTGGEPTMYERTGALGDTPRTTAPTVSGDTISFEAYLDTKHQYTSGSNPNMQQVLELANYGKPFITKNGYPAKPTVGNQGFWERATAKMQDTFYDTLKKFFN